MSDDHDVAGLLRYSIPSRCQIVTGGVKNGHTLANDRIQTLLVAFIVRVFIQAAGG